LLIARLFLRQGERFMNLTMPRAVVRHALPQSVLELVKRGLAFQRLKRASKSLADSRGGPDWLAPELIGELSVRYPVAKDLKDLSVCAASQVPDHEAAATIIRCCGQDARSFLEIGGGPGLVSWGLVAASRQATCLDILDEVAEGARGDGVVAVVGDACRMMLPDDSFDAAFSYNAFEHIDDPAAALIEAWRVVRPGGRVHLSFAPIYNAPWGLHAFYEFGIPFIQHLWDEDTLRSRVTSEDLWHLNHWSLAQYRNLWTSVSDKLKIISYSEEHNYDGLELIEEFPSCFAKRSRDIDEFTTSKFVITFLVLK
jgi:SAM-dependent methyltransferase